MRIVVTDGYTLNPRDLSWQSIEAFGDITVYDRSAEDTLVERCGEADIILSNKTVFSKKTIDQLHKPKLISVLAAGYNVIDIRAARENGVIVCNTPGYGTATVAQHTIALLLELTNHVGLHLESVADGDWVRSKDWCYGKTTIIELAGKTIGIVGFGNIGRKVAEIARAFDMKIIYYSAHKKETQIAEFVELKILFQKSDFISLHCPLKSDNHQFVNKEILQLMKPSAFLINTARGQLINEQDLADALNNKLIAGAALDVLATEPPNADNPLLSAKNCILTPHNAWMSKEARERILDITTKNIEAFLQGKPINVVN
jgi:glycerate dehydrogenase